MHKPKLDKIFNLRLTWDDFHELQRKSADLRISVSDLIRMSLTQTETISGR